MGDKRPSIRTLPDGYKIIHHPPSEAHPQGKMVLCPGQSRVRERLLAAHPAHREAHQKIKDRHYSLVERKRLSLAAHPAVPASKRCC